MTRDDNNDEDREARRTGGRPEPAGEQLGEVSSDLAAIVVAHPAGAIAAAIGVGYVLGGGVFTRLTSGLLRLGLRLGVQFALLPALENEVATLMGSGGTPSNGGGAHQPSAPETLKS
jgi:hypothetical protein